MILEKTDPALLAAAFCDIARARGMSEIANAFGITREALYKELRPDAQPCVDTVNRVCAALGVKLVAQAVHTWRIRAKRVGLDWFPRPRKRSLLGSKVGTDAAA